mgnify:CR=1 FL=1
MENKVFTVAISSTSKKEKEFKSNRLTAYIVPASEDEKNKMVEFGLNPYTSTDDETFFIMKTSAKIRLYMDNSNGYVELDGTDQGDLFKTKPNETVKINVIVGENKGNRFYRLQSILDTDNVITKIESENPFD